MAKAIWSAALVAAILIGVGERPEARQKDRNPGISTVCGSFSISVDLLLGTIDLFSVYDEGWAWVDRNQRIREATGVAENVKVAGIDSFSNHDSHDLDFEVALDVDPNQNDLLSFNNELGVEWETGINPAETSGEGANPIIPKWAWPSNGDRVWVNGHWIFDCGHPENDLYHTEIHPPRALATMRDQASPLPGTGTTPVPVTLTDLYIHGRGGFTVQQLNCGPEITLDFDTRNNCGQPTPPADQSYKTTPINDTDFSFSVCLPPRPPLSVFNYVAELGPGNTVALEPEVKEAAATGACATDAGFDHTRMATVTVKLKNTATTPQDVYARRIYAGWVSAPAEPFGHRRLTLLSTNLTEDHDLDPGDGELTFWWMNVNRAPLAWLRLSDHAGGMDDYDDETGFGDGEKSYANAFRDFYLRTGQTFSVRSRGYEQDCNDTLGAFGIHYFSLPVYVACRLQIPDQGDLTDLGANDGLSNADAEFSDTDLGPETLHSSDYDMRVRVDDIPLVFEDTSYLSLGMSCTPTGEVALVGQPLACTTRVDNAGPGLARTVGVTTRFDAGPPTAAVSAASWAVGGSHFATGPNACATTSAQSLCNGVIVPVAAATPARVTTTATPSAAGILTVRGEVTSPSTDPEPGNNTGSTTIEVFQGITVDISPGDATNIVNLKRGGTVTVAILTTATFNAATINPTAVCFGDAEAPAERACAEQHGSGHLQDVNKDKRPDLVLHFDVGATGIDLGDAKACLIARTTGGTGAYGCDVLTPK